MRGVIQCKFVRMKAVYDGNSYSNTIVFNGAINFAKEKIHQDLVRPRLARVAESNEGVRPPETALPANRRNKVGKFSQMLSLKVRNVHFTIHSLHYHKVAAQWITPLLNGEQKNLRSVLSVQHLIRYQRQGNVQHQIIAGDEFRCYHYEPGFKCQSAMQA